MNVVFLLAFLHETHQASPESAHGNSSSAHENVHKDMLGRFFHACQLRLRAFQAAAAAASREETDDGTGRRDSQLPCTQLCECANSCGLICKNPET